MKGKRVKLALLSVMLVVMLVVSVNGSVLNGYYCQALPVSCETPKVILQSGTAGSSTIYTNSTSAKVSVAAPRNWWNSDYDYQRQISIVNNVASTLGSGYSVCLTVNTTSLVSSGKMLLSGNDLRIVYWNGSSWIETDRNVIDMNTGSTQVWFKTRADISASGSDNNNYMYYGNPSAVNPPANKSNVYDFWDDFDDASLDPAWTFSQIGGAAGSYSESGTVVILNATNSGDLWGTSDNFLFLSISRSYDVLVESYTSGWGGSHQTWSKMGGVQLRQSVDANSKNRIMSPVYSAVGATNSYRLSTGGSTSEQTTATQPRHNRLSRTRGTSRAWYSTDGTSWTELGSQISFSGELSDSVRLGIHLAGLSSSSHWVEVDWFKVRKYVDPEPSTYTGTEERADWLSGWDKRVKITIDNNDVDNALSNFPVLAYLSNSSGRNSDDVSFVFDELQIDANRKKIVVTTSDGITQCYVEIEKWDTANEKAWLWVKVPSISSSADTDLYLYYDSSQDDNTNYVGGPDSTPAENVWDTNYVMVQHLAETSGTHYDSTSNDNDDTSKSVNIQGGDIGKIDGADDFDDASSNYVTFPTSGMSTSAGAVSLWANLDHAHPTRSYFFCHRPGAEPNRIYLYEQGGIFYIGFANVFQTSTGYSIPLDEWHFYVLKWSGTNWYAYVDGQLVASGSYDGLTNTDSTCYLGTYKNTEEYLDGIIDEVRISNTTRSAAWIKASYETGRDNLLSFGSEESPTYDSVLKIVNQVADNWQVNLQVYDSSNTGRLSNMTISFHDGETSDQIVVSGGNITQSEGTLYDLAGSVTIYISISNLQATTSETSYIYVYLKILVPSTSTYNLFVITLEIA